MIHFTKKAVIACSLLAISTSFFAQSAHSNVYKPIPKDVLPIVKHTKVLSLNDSAKTNFTGEYSGQRFQYTDNKKAILRSYTYTMNIIQNGTNVSGTTTITSDNGDYGIIKLRGMVIEDKLYFEEYEIIDQKKSDDALWCFKIGELQMGKHLQNTVIYGPTNSYTSIYYSPCSGGYTMLEKINSNEEPSTIVKKQQGPDKEITNVSEENKFGLTIYPNPFSTETNIAYTLEKEAKVLIELYDINGALLKTVSQEVQSAGNHTTTINGSSLAGGVYVIKISIDGLVSSKQIIKTNN